MSVLSEQYNFFDSLGAIQNSTVSVRERILSHEHSIEDPRVTKELQVITREKKRQFLFKDSMAKLGLYDQSEVRLFKDNAPVGAFATNKLEKLDMNIRSQALTTYAFRQMAFQYGGGAIESIKGFKRNIQFPTGGLIGGDTNQVRIVNVDFEALSVPVKPLVYGLKLGFVDSLKNAELGYDALTANAEAIQMAWALDVDRVTFFGSRGENGSTADVSGAPRGLFNQESVTVTDLQTETAYTQTIKKLEKLPIKTVIDIIINELNAMATSVDFKPELMPNKILAWKEFYAFLFQTADNAGGTATPFRTNMEILKEALRNWASIYNADEVRIDWNPYLSPTVPNKPTTMVANGTNSTGRMVMYRHDAQTSYIPLPMDLTSGAIVFDINLNAYRQNWISFIGYMLLFYPETVRYVDNGTTAS